MKINLAKEDVRKVIDGETNIISYLYRPFDYRYTYYSGLTRGFHSRPRREIMKHLVKPNIALFVGRQGLALGNEEWTLIFCGDKIED